MDAFEQVEVEGELRLAAGFGQQAEGREAHRGVDSSLEDSQARSCR